MQAHAGVFHPSTPKLSQGRHIMQTPVLVLNIGADVAKDEIVAACSEGSFPVRKVANQRAAVLAFLKGLPAGSRIGVESAVAIMSCSRRLPTSSVLWSSCL